MDEKFLMVNTEKTLVVYWTADKGTTGNRRGYSHLLTAITTASLGLGTLCGLVGLTWLSLDTQALAEKQRSNEIAVERFIKTGCVWNQNPNDFMVYAVNPGQTPQDPQRAGYGTVVCDFRGATAVVGANGMFTDFHIVSDWQAYLEAKSATIPPDLAVLIQEETWRGVKLPLVVPTFD